MTKTRPPLKPRSWQLQTAKAKFSELFRRARSEGPQYVTRQGQEAVVVLPVEEYDRLTTRNRQPVSLLRFLAGSPFRNRNLKLQRTLDYGREIKLNVFRRRES
jgi:antitoxin Phd